MEAKWPPFQEPFTLEKYKEDLRKTYTCITLFLCPLDDASDTEPEQHCTSELECLESLSDAWLNNVDLGKDDTDILPAFDIFQRSPVTSSSTTAFATTSGSFTSTPSSGAQCSSSSMCSLVLNLSTSCFHFILWICHLFGV